MKIIIQITAPDKVASHIVSALPLKMITCHRAITDPTQKGRRKREKIILKSFAKNFTK